MASQPVAGRRGAKKRGDCLDSAGLPAARLAVALRPFLSPILSPENPARG